MFRNINTYVGIILATRQTHGTMPCIIIILHAMQTINIVMVVRDDDDDDFMMTIMRWGFIRAIIVHFNRRAYCMYGMRGDV